MCYRWTRDLVLSVADDATYVVQCCAQLKPPGFTALYSGSGLTASPELQAARTPPCSTADALILAAEQPRMQVKVPCAVWCRHRLCSTCPPWRGRRGLTYMDVIPLASPTPSGEASWCPPDQAGCLARARRPSFCSWSSNLPPASTSLSDARPLLHLSSTSAWTGWGGWTWLA